MPNSLTRADWLRIGASLAAVAPVVALGSQDAAVAAPNAAETVTVLGAGGKTGRECVEYLASRGTGIMVKEGSHCIRCSIGVVCGG